MSRTASKFDRPASLWESVKFGGSTHALISFEDQERVLESQARFVAHRATGLARQRDRFQGLPSGEIPRCKAVPIKMPAIIHIAPWPNVSLQCLCQDRLDEIPIPVVVQRVRNEMELFEFGGGRFMLDID